MSKKAQPKTPAQTKGTSKRPSNPKSKSSPKSKSTGKKKPKTTAIPQSVATAGRPTITSKHPAPVAGTRNRMKKKAKSLPIAEYQKKHFAKRVKNGLCTRCKTGKLDLDRSTTRCPTCLDRDAEEHRRKHNGEPPLPSRRSKALDEPIIAAGKLSAKMVKAVKQAEQKAKSARNAKGKSKPKSAKVIPVKRSNPKRPTPKAKAGKGKATKPKRVKMTRVPVKERETINLTSEDLGTTNLSDTVE